MEAPTMYQLMSQYKGKSISQFFIYSYNNAGNKQTAALRVTGLIEEVQALNLSEDCNQFMKDEIVDRLFNADFWKEDASEYPYLFYDYFVLGYGDMLKSIPNDEAIFSMFNCVTYGVVLLMYDDPSIYRFAKKNSGRSIFDLFRKK